ncbi:unnamed protein product [Pleuronectes platessa]|uniref:Uncharacterized protein n=1 Tax=Pleuronectes platessa TaxID=8262 RepID=A0A9N7UR92_PLEPL|nr:unnamed protein product [Pleuronectes platessa]
MTVLKGRMTDGPKHELPREGGGGDRRRDSGTCPATQVDSSMAAQRQSSETLEGGAVAAQGQSSEAQEVGAMAAQAQSSEAREGGTMAAQGQSSEAREGGTMDAQG